MQTERRLKIEEEYARDRERKQAELFTFTIRDTRRALHIGNPILRAAIARDAEAANNRMAMNMLLNLNYSRPFRQS